MSDTENPAETLRRAAALMRERAEAADTCTPWQLLGLDDDYAPPWTVASTHPEGERTYVCHDARHAGEHIASWHPTVALAAAKAIDDVADAWEICDDGWTRDMDDDAIRFEDTVDGGWLNVARAYLGARP